jgi:hypothetical protein
MSLAIVRNRPPVRIERTPGRCPAMYTYGEDLWFEMRCCDLPDGHDEQEHHDPAAGLWNIVTS